MTIAGIIGTGEGILWGLGVGGVLGGAYALADTIRKSKDEDSFLKNVWKVIAKTSAAAFSAAAVGAGIGALAGVASGADIGGCNEWNRKYCRKKT